MLQMSPSFEIQTNVHINMHISLGAGSGSGVRCSRSNPKLAVPSFINLGDSLNGLSSSLHSAISDRLNSSMNNSNTNYRRLSFDIDAVDKLRHDLGIQVRCNGIHLLSFQTSNYNNLQNWDASMTSTFVTTAVKGFLRADLYNCLTEFLCRAEGSFGLQVHSTLEPGVVVIGSKVGWYS